MSVIVAFPRPKTSSASTLKHKQLKALRFIEGHIAKNGGWPSFVEVQRAADLGSRLGTVRTVNQLFRAGAISRPS